jgi:hypothetical protein
MEYELNVPGYVLRIAVLSSPHISESDAGFRTSLLKRLAKIIIDAGGEMRKRAILCFCILCATDGELITVAKAR